jgi:hypothetical protein
MDFTDDAASVAGIINWILFVVAPIEEILIGDLDLPTVTDEIDPMVSGMEVPLNTQPSVNATLTNDHVI